MGLNLLAELYDTGLVEYEVHSLLIGVLGEILWITGIHRRAGCLEAVVGICRYGYIWRGLDMVAAVIAVTPSSLPLSHHWNVGAWYTPKVPRIGECIMISHYSKGLSGGRIIWTVGGLFSSNLSTYILYIELIHKGCNIITHLSYW